ERFSLHSTDWREPVGRREYKKSGPAGHQSCLCRTGLAEKTNAMVRSRRVFFTNRQNVGKSRSRDITRAQPSNPGCLRDQEHRADRARVLAVQKRILQCAEPYEPGTAESDCVFRNG